MKKRIRNISIGIILLIFSPICTIIDAAIEVFYHSYICDMVGDFWFEIKYKFFNYSCLAIGLIFPKFINAGWYRLYNPNRSASRPVFFWTTPTSKDIIDTKWLLGWSNRLNRNATIEDLHWEKETRW